MRHVTYLLIGGGLASIRAARQIRALDPDGSIEIVDHRYHDWQAVGAPSLLADPPGPLTGVDAAAAIHPDARLVPPVRIEAVSTTKSCTAPARTTPSTSQR